MTEEERTECQFIRSNRIQAGPNLGFENQLEVFEDLVKKELKNDFFNKSETVIAHD